MRVRNKGDLLSHGNTEGRKALLEIAERAVSAVDPYKAAKALISLKEEGTLTLGTLIYTPEEGNNIYVVGAGKATFPIANALDEILGARIRDGVINLKRGEGHRLRHIGVREAGHPMPDAAGVEGAREMLRIARRAGPGDLVICCFTGGSSATCPLPPKGVSLEDKQRLTELLLRSGATIQEMNAVRKHVSRIKGGRLAKAIHPAKVVNLTVSDVVGDPLDCVTDLTVPDASTVQDAVGVLRRYSLWEQVPRSVRSYLEGSDPNLETPKELPEVEIHNFMLATNRDMCTAAKEVAEQIGYRSQVLTSMMEGEAREVGTVLASIARCVERFGEPITPPCVLVTGGETTVRLPDHAGEGGRNQELILSFAMKVASSDRIVAAAIASDGTDGPTEIAGGIVDGYTAPRAAARGIDLYGELARHNSSGVLTELGDVILTGPTGTNVMDLHLALVGGG